MNKLTEAECAAWLKIRSQETPQVFPTAAQTAEQWQGLILRQMRVPAETTTGIDDVGVWAMITTIDMDNIQDIIRRIARYGVLGDEEPGGGSGDGHDIGSGQTQASDGPQPMNARTLDLPHDFGLHRRGADAAAD